MLGFVVPFKAKSKSKNWIIESYLLKQTLISICSQTDKVFKVFVVYTDLPDIPFTHENVFFIYFPFTFCSNEILKQQKINIEQNLDNAIDERMFDQGKRILFGCIFAKKENCNFVMSVDADDLVSNRLTAFINKNGQEKIGWYVNKGYILNGGSKILLKIREHMNNINGSTNIVNINLIPEVDFNSKLLSEFSFFSAHAYLKDRLFSLYNESPKPVPFYAVIYRLHNYNWTGYKSVLNKQRIKTFLKYLIRGKVINRRIKNEFRLTFNNG